MKKTLPLIDGRGSIFDVRSHLFHDTGGVYPVQDSKTDSPKDGGNCGGRRVPQETHPYTGSHIPFLAESSAPSLR